VVLASGEGSEAAKRAGQEFGLGCAAFAHWPFLLFNFFEMSYPFRFLLFKSFGCGLPRCGFGRRVKLPHPPAKFPLDRFALTG
jgi:hypothetical protein